MVRRRGAAACGKRRFTGNRIPAGCSRILDRSQSESAALLRVESPGPAVLRIGDVGAGTSWIEIDGGIQHLPIGAGTDRGDDADLDWDDDRWRPAFESFAVVETPMASVTKCCWRRATVLRFRFS